MEASRPGSSWCSVHRHNLGRELVDESLQLRQSAPNRVETLGQRGFAMLALGAAMGRDLVLTPCREAPA